MCSEFDAVDDDDRMLQFFGVSYANKGDMQRTVAKRRQTFPTGAAPFIRLHEPGSGNKVLDEGTFGLLPGFAKEVAYGRKTYNARTETVHEKPSFRESWAKGWRCIVPVETLYEYSYESGSAERVAVRRTDRKPLAVAGIYRQWDGPAGKQLWSFAMLTVNAAGHPVYQRLHGPQDEKRMVVILDLETQDDWLTCSVEDASRFFEQWRGSLEAIPAARPRRRGPQQAL